MKPKIEKMLEVERVIAFRGIEMERNSQRRKFSELKDRNYIKKSNLLEKRKIKRKGERIKRKCRRL